MVFEFSGENRPRVDMDEVDEVGGKGNGSLGEWRAQWLEKSEDGLRRRHLFEKIWDDKEIFCIEFIRIEKNYP